MLFRRLYSLGFCSIVGRQQRSTLVSSLASLSWFWSKGEKKSKRRTQCESEAGAGMALHKAIKKRDIRLISFVLKRQVTKGVGAL